MNETESAGELKAIYFFTKFLANVKEKKFGRR